MEVPAEETEEYFFSPSVDKASLPINQHLQIVHEGLEETFPTDPLALACLQKALLKVAKLIDSSIAAKVKEVYRQLKFPTKKCMRLRGLLL